MGGDHGVHSAVPAAISMLRKHPGLELILVGRKEIVEAAIGKPPGPGLKVHDAREVVGMDEHPADVLRKKKDSSMRVCINLVKEGQADACVSAGNTGALMATGRFVLKTLPGIDRPAIMAIVPTKHDRTYMLDLGANSNCTAEQLFQFAVMGSVVVHDIEGIDQPRVGLLNIGEEDIKGNDTIREAAELLSGSSLNYVGFIEGDTIPDQKADVVVCDGFSGNVALKTMEGTAKLVSHFLEQEFRGSLYGRIAGLVALPVLRSLRRRLDPRRYNGASLVGLNGIVIKSHGGADALAFEQAIRVAIVEVEQNVPEQIGRLLQQQRH
ncbi:MAG TPA: phosphate acyltransferase PlsX [Chromatiales bacterium]|nr:phosphate acyltransferase PlsX [Chromatiales bacterium]